MSSYTHLTDEEFVRMFRDLTFTALEVEAFRRLEAASEEDKRLNDEIKELESILRDRDETITRLEER